MPTRWRSPRWSSVEAGVPVDVIDVGGGFPVSYPDVTPPPLAAYFAEIESAIVRLRLTGVALWAEPGRALVAAGTSVVVQVQLRRGDALYINDGVYGSLSDAGAPGFRFPARLIRPTMPIRLAETYDRSGCSGRPATPPTAWRDRSCCRPTPGRRLDRDRPARRLRRGSAHRLQRLRPGAAGRRVRSAAAGYARLRPRPDARRQSFRVAGDARMKHASFSGNLVIVGFGSIGQGVLPLILRHLDMRSERITIVTAERARLTMKRKLWHPLRRRAAHARELSPGAGAAAGRGRLPAQPVGRRLIGRLDRVRPGEGRPLPRHLHRAMGRRLHRSDAVARRSARTTRCARARWRCAASTRKGRQRC